MYIFLNLSILFQKTMLILDLEYTSNLCASFFKSDFNMYIGGTIQKSIEMKTSRCRYTHMYIKI